MIEVEQKFLLNPEQEEKLLKGATFDYEKTNIDTYYDTEDYTLGLESLWLRLRNDRWELKIGQNKNSKVSSRTHVELEDDLSIAVKLGLPGMDLTREIEIAGYKPFAKIEKTRRSYLRDGLRIDLDNCDFGYAVVEIELLIESMEEQQEANDRISAFAKSIDLDTRRVRGKLIEYMARYLPEHHQALLDAGVLDKI
ncbi:MAG: CYTH domain-containing protein [Parcubacteria group bacterium]|nr:CYTH domain-containing protein [Parcubacteria group bacterium]